MARPRAVRVGQTRRDEVDPGMREGIRARFGNTGLDARARVSSRNAREPFEVSALRVTPAACCIHAASGTAIDPSFQVSLPGIRRSRMKRRLMPGTQEKPNNIKVTMDGPRLHVVPSNVDAKGADKLIKAIQACQALLDDEEAAG
jgi:hypothetical protein